MMTSIMLLLVISKVIRAARVNLVDSLRYE
jgi:hypothetical protein